MCVCVSLCVCVCDYIERDTQREADRERERERCIYTYNVMPVVSDSCPWGYTACAQPDTSTDLYPTRIAPCVPSPDLFMYFSSRDEKATTFFSPTADFQIEFHPVNAFMFFEKRK